MNFYFSAAGTLDRLDRKQGSIKGVLASLPEKDRKRTSALVIQTLKYKPVLKELIDKTGLLREERKKITSESLALVLVHDVLFTSGGIQAGDGPVKQAILRHKTRLNGELQKLKIRRGVSSNSELAQAGAAGSEDIPRYVRVNTLVWTCTQALDYYSQKGFQCVDSYDGSSKSIAKDAHVPNLLLFHPSVSFQNDSAYTTGKVILQDKASCFPAVVLAPPRHKTARVIDATAAPGNKTSHLSALMEDNGKLFAFERDRKRFGTLQRMLSKAHCRNTEAVNADFLTIEPEDSKYIDVTHILLDPSCSGSGIVNRLDHLLENPEEEEDEDQAQDRLKKLSSFQLSMIQHAMKCKSSPELLHEESLTTHVVPNVQKIVYSTCSVHVVENEGVVRAALNSEEARSGNFVLAPRTDVLPTWSRRGLEDEAGSSEDAEKLVRCLPASDATNGFFVSCFIRQQNLKRPASPDPEAQGTDMAGSQAKKKKKRRKSKHKQEA